jgi:hypothetical protein
MVAKDRSFLGVFLVHSSVWHGCASEWDALEYALFISGRPKAKHQAKGRKSQMEGQELQSEGIELFNEQALLVLMDGDRSDAKAILTVGVAEMRETVERLERSARACDFAGVMLAASGAQGIAAAICSKALGDSACRISKTAFLRDIGAVRNACLDLRGCLRLVEIRLRRENWI